LIALDLVLVAFAVRGYRRESSIYRLIGQRTPNALAEAVERSPGIRDRLLVNLGNLYLEQAVSAGQPGPARAALSYYRDALRLNPELLEAKRNFEIAQRFLDALVPPREPREPRPPDRMRSSERPLTPNDI
jgi:hypothetical protein